MLSRIIPFSGEHLPVIGMGTWQSFDIYPAEYPKLGNVLDTMLSLGGSVIDCSPMYGKAEKVVGDVTASLPTKDAFFYATKVWIHGLENGMEQIKQSMMKMRRTTMDLVQIHNLTDWQTHLPYLRRMKEVGSIRYIGLTHYRDSSHAELENIIAAEPIDFIQFNYSVANRNAEKRLLDAAADRGVAVIINRPFGEGQLFNAVKNQSIPPWAVEAGFANWASFFLCYVLAHPAVTCIIPATSNAAHAVDNCMAASAHLPNHALRMKMAAWIDAL